MLKIKKINDLSQSKLGKKRTTNHQLGSNSSLLNNIHNKSTSSVHNNSSHHNKSKSNHPTHQTSVNHQNSINKTTKNNSTQKNLKKVGSKLNNVTSNSNLKCENVQNYIKGIKNSLKVKK
jgi:hypothetical protein